MPTFTFSGPWYWYAAWNLLAFAAAAVLNSFIEWWAHHYILHGTRFGRFAYDLHHVGHHGMFRADNPMFSSLGLYDGWLTATDVLQLNLDGAIVALSACASAGSPGAGGGARPTASTAPTPASPQISHSRRTRRQVQNRPR